MPPYIDVTTRQKCLDCGLFKWCTHPCITGRGNNIDPRFILIGEAPGKDEDKLDDVFIGAAGNVLNEVIAGRTDFYLLNCVKCCAYEDPISKNKSRNPVPAEIAYCNELLWKQLIELVRSAVSHGVYPIIVPLGANAYNAVTMTENTRISDVAGKSQPITIAGHELELIPNYHPAYTIYNRNKKGVYTGIFGEIFAKFNVGRDDEHFEIISPPQFFKLAELMLRKRDQIPNIIFDIETAMEDEKLQDAKLLGFSLNAEPFFRKSYYVPLILKDFDDWEVTPAEREQCVDWLGELLKVFPIIGHNIKYDIAFCIYNMIVKHTDVKVADDTIFLANYIYNRTLGNLRLKDLCVKLLGAPWWDKPIEDELKKHRLLKNRHFGNIPTKILGKYGAGDAYYNRRLHEFLSAKIAPNLDKLREVFNKATPYFANAEAKGIKLDGELYEFLKFNYGVLIKDLIKGFREIPQVLDYMLDTQEEFSPGSVKKIMFRELQGEDKYFDFPVVLRSEKIIPGETQGRPSADKDVLAALEVNKNLDSNHKKFVGLLQKYRKITKLQSTYINSVPNLTDMETMLYRPNYNLVGAVTGRLSSGFHTLPKKSDVKRMYKSRFEGGIIISADESQLELRVMASLAKEEKWINGFNAGHDQHQTTGAIIHSVDYDDVTEEMRRIGKTTNFAVVYGKSAYNLGITLGVDTKEAQSYIDRLFDGADKLKSWIDFQHKFVIDNGFVVTPFSRVLIINEANYKHDKAMLSRAHRLSVNYPTQSTASDLVVSTIVDMCDEFIKHGLKSMFIGTVHDSILVDVAPGELPTVLRIMKEVAELRQREKYKWLICPLRLDISIGTRWGNAADIEIEELDNEHIKGRLKAKTRDITELNKEVSKAYNWEYEIINTYYKEDQSYENFIRGTEIQEIELNLATKPQPILASI